MANTFLVSVANAIGRDPNTKEAIFIGKANLSSAFKLSMASTDVRGGINNPLLYKYMHDRDLEVTIDQAIFGKSFLALNVGNNILNSTVNVAKTESITLSSGAGVATETPIGNISVIKADGTISTVTPSGKNFTVVGGADTCVTIHYTYADAVDRLTIETTKPPSVIDLILEAEVRDNKGNLVEIFQINVPSFQVSGNYELSMSADGVSQESLVGNALATTGSTCANGDIYATVSWIPVTATITYAGIATTPAVFEPAVASLPATQQVTVYGLRGGSFMPNVITSECTFTKLAGGDSDITVSAGGLITVAGTATATDTATIKATFTDGVTTFVDHVIVTVKA